MKLHFNNVSNLIFMFRTKSDPKEIFGSNFKTNMLHLKDLILEGRYLTVFMTIEKLFCQNPGRLKQFLVVKNFLCLDLETEITR